MKTHPYLRAYMAGIAVPTAFLLILVGVGQITHYLGPEDQQYLWFPLAVAPNAFGAWNILYVFLHRRWHHPIGLQGAALPFFIAPIGFAFGNMQGIVRLGSNALIYFDGAVRLPYSYVTFMLLIGVAVYYLVWKYLIGYLNRTVELPS